MPALRPALCSLVLLPLLAACNAATPVAVAPAVAPGGYNSTRFPVVAMPEGSGCAAVIGRYDAVMKADYESGNVGAKVFDQIQNELAGARSACAAGRDGEARGLVSASKSRHGYPG